VVQPGLFSLPPGMAASASYPSLADGKSVAWVHPWSLAARPEADHVLGVLHVPFHERFPWSARRWQFVTQAMRAVCDEIWIGDLSKLLQARVGPLVQVRMTLNPGYREVMGSPGTEVSPEPRLTPDPDDLKPSFSRFWEHVLTTRGIDFSRAG